MKVDVRSIGRHLASLAWGGGAVLRGDVIRLGVARGRPGGSVVLLPARVPLVLRVDRGCARLHRVGDDALVRKLGGGLRLWTVLAIIGLPLVVALQTWILILLLHAKG